MTTTPETRPHVARLRGAAELAAALPHLCGYQPTESLVAVALHGDRSRVGLTMRLDLPPRAYQEALVADVADRLAATGARAALVVVCTEAPDAGGLPRAALIRRLRRRLSAAGVAVDDALLIRRGRWTSYVCRNERCCPAEGTPLARPGGSEALALIAADAVGRGVAVLSSRQELVERLSAPPASTDVLAALSAARERQQAQRAARGRAAAGRQALAVWRRALAAAPAAAPAPDERAELVCSLDDVVVRDTVLTALLHDGDAVLWLLHDLVRWTPSPHDVPLCALLAWTAHSRGDGAVANVALDRALAADPGCTLALLCHQALDALVDPTEVRAMVADSRRVLRAAHPWTAAF